MRWLKRGYEALLARIVRRPRPAYRRGRRSPSRPASPSLPFLGESLFPTFKERDFLCTGSPRRARRSRRSAGSSPAASHDLRQFPGVRNFGSHIGQAFLAEEIVGVNFGENWISIDPTADYDKTLSALEEVVDGYPGSSATSRPT